MYDSKQILFWLKKIGIHVDKTKIRSDKIRKCIDEASIKNKFDDKTDDDADGDMGISMLNVDTASIDVV